MSSPVPPRKGAAMVAVLRMLATADRLEDEAVALRLRANQLRSELLGHAVPVGELRQMQDEVAAGYLHLSYTPDCPHLWPDTMG